MDFWTRRAQHNVLFLKYEDLHKDFDAIVLTIAKFLDVSLTDDELATINQHCTFDSMKNNPSTNYKHWDDIGVRKKDGCQYMRRGKYHLDPCLCIFKRAA